MLKRATGPKAFYWGLGLALAAGAAALNVLWDGPEKLRIFGLYIGLTQCVWLAPLLGWSYLYRAGEFALGLIVGGMVVGLYPLLIALLYFNLGIIRTK